MLTCRRLAEDFLFLFFEPIFAKFLFVFVYLLVVLWAWRENSSVCCYIEVCTVAYEVLRLGHMNSSRPGWLATGSFRSPLSTWKTCSAWKFPRCFWSSPFPGSRNVMWSLLRVLWVPVHDLKAKRFESQKPVRTCTGVWKSLSFRTCRQGYWPEMCLNSRDRFQLDVRRPVYSV